MRALTGLLFVSCLLLGCCPLNCTHVWNYEMALALYVFIVLSSLLFFYLFFHFFCFLFFSF